MAAKKRRVRCPRCGRLAHARRHTDGSVLYVHAAKAAPHGLPFVEVTDSCYVAAPKKEGSDAPVA